VKLSVPGKGSPPLQPYFPIWRREAIAQGSQPGVRHIPTPKPPKLEHIFKIRQASKLFGAKILEIKGVLESAKDVIW
jgi:hypothetical protein